MSDVSFLELVWFMCELTRRLSLSKIYSDLAIVLDFLSEQNRNICAKDTKERKIVIAK